LLRRRLTEFYGETCRIVAIRRTPFFPSELYIVDVMVGARLTRLMGAVGEGGELTEQSGMDLLHPERLLFLYERLMLLAFALVPNPRTALLLGLGGGAMCRHLQAYLPNCAVDVVEHDEGVIELARRYFHITQPVISGDAEEVVAKAPGPYDLVLVDLYDGSGAARVAPLFWRDCASALAPGGCLAVNWAEFLDTGFATEEAARVSEVFGRSFFIGTRDPRDNVVQIAPTDPGFALSRLASSVERFAATYGLPREDREVLKRSTLRAAFPLTSRRS